MSFFMMIMMQSKHSCYFYDHDDHDGDIVDAVIGLEDVSDVGHDGDNIGQRTLISQPSLGGGEERMQAVEIVCCQNLE